jgi:hypothetical protein
MGTVIEARLDKARGPVATLLVTNGTLQAGQALVVGTASGRVRVMTDWRGNQIRKAGPSRAVEITGLTEVPEAGDEFYAVREERIAIDIAARRKEKQPLEYPSAGSFFKRPAGHFAGALIEGAGLKGLSVGGAQVSEKHAGFLINKGGATAADFLKLMEEVQERVMEKYGVRLEPEVRIVGEDP